MKDSAPSADRLFLLDVLNPFKTPLVPLAQREDARRLLRSLDASEAPAKKGRK